MKAINQERDMCIYHARKDDKRTFVDISKEYGISPQRVRAIYRLLDWRLNGVDADHHKDEPLVLFPWEEVVKDPKTGYFTVKRKAGTYEADCTCVPDFDDHGFSCHG